MDQSELLRYFTGVLEQLGLQYFVTERGAVGLFMSWQQDPPSQNQVDSEIGPPVMRLDLSRLDIINQSDSL